MERSGARIRPGCCGENVDVSDDMELHTLLPGVMLSLGGDASVRITAVGKDAADGHADAVIPGNIFPTEGLFAEVVAGGRVVPGDSVEIARRDGYAAGVLTVSDSASAGLREDLSGPAVLELLGRSGFVPARYAVVPDDRAEISSRLRRWCGDGSLDILFTTGGTGFSPRDVTPEATCAVCERMVPGIPEMIRSLSAAIVPTAWLSRAVSGLHGGTLVVNLPGSRKAAVECCGFALRVVGHGLEILRGESVRCGG